MKQQLNLTKVKVVKKGYNELEMPSIYPHFLVNNEITNPFYRIAHYLHITGGENLVSPLEYYSDHVKDLAVDSKRMQIAIGPRMVNWVGPNELSLAITKAQDMIEEDEPYKTDMEKYQGIKEYSKPTGIDQLYETYWDIVNRSLESSIVIRDPEIDLDDNTVFTPELINITFSRHDDELIMFANFGVYENDSTFINDLYFLMHIRYLYQLWLVNQRINSVRLFIKVNNALEDLDINFIRNIEPLMGNDPDKYWGQIRSLRQYNMNSMSFFNESTFNNEKVSVEKLLRILNEQFFNVEEDTNYEYPEINIPLIKDMALALTIGGFLRYDKDKKYISNVNEMLNEMKTGIKFEVESYIADNE